MATYLQQDDEGVLIVVTVYQEDGTTPYDLSTSTDTEIWLGPPSGEPLHVTATFTTDGTDGKLEYQVVAGDLSVNGTWNVQAVWQESGNQRHSTVTSFEVYRNVE